MIKEVILHVSIRSLLTCINRNLTLSKECGSSRSALSDLRSWLGRRQSHRDNCIGQEPTFALCFRSLALITARGAANTYRSSIEVGAL
jgi:hypothetical protein